MSQNVLRLDNWAQFEDLKNRLKGKHQNLDIPVANKFHSQMTEAEGIKFHSKKEAKVFRELQARQHAKEIKFILMQVPFLLPGKDDRGKRTRHYLDFMVIRTDGQIEYIEVKGRDLPMGKLKRRQVEEIYGIKIVVV